MSKPTRQMTPMRRRSFFHLLFGSLAGLLLSSCFADEKEKMDHPARSEKSTNSGPPKEGTEVATLGAGCFWCIEAVLEQLDGVLEVRSGYMGGHVENPTYEQVCSKTTGHAEVVQVTFDPEKISFKELLVSFWKLHDPTTLNRQGNDVGPQYRSAIFYHSEAQREAAEASKKKLEEAGVYPDPIVTEIKPASTFWVAEDYHQDFYRNNKGHGYCRLVIAPKLDKLGLDK